MLNYAPSQGKHEGAESAAEASTSLTVGLLEEQGNVLQNSLDVDLPQRQELANKVIQLKEEFTVLLTEIRRRRSIGDGATAQTFQVQS